MVIQGLPLGFAESLSATSYVFLLAALGLALVFEFVNGFHDTANAVATVIYTNTLSPWVAVVWSGVWNLVGVLVSSGAVAYAVLALLPTELLLNVGSSAGFAMIFALLISAILWNLGTWYLGLPASSSHTLIGSILGVGLANALMTGHSFADGMNWSQVRAVFTSLMISPVVGFVAAGLLLLALKTFVRNPALFKPPAKDQQPPWWIRGTLLLTCTGVSFAHGSNDGQKGMGLLLLILIGVLPAEYALNLNARAEELRKLETTAALMQPMFEAHAGTGATDTGGNVEELSQYLRTDGKLTARTYAAAAATNRELMGLIENKASLRDVPMEQRKGLRTDLYLVDQTVAKLIKTCQIADAAEQKSFGEYRTLLDQTTKYLPVWVKVAVAIALGLGTMIGWKRIVRTVGEKIGKEHLNYGQGASAELVAMATIGAADWFGMPVSTTHVLSSGVAGTMAANRSGLQAATLRNVLLAWVLTLPVCMLLGAGTFSAALYIVFNHLIPQAVITGGLVVVLAIACGFWIKQRAAGRREVPEAIAV
jgi:inorganic phosphate transporter, PiT family